MPNRYASWKFFLFIGSALIVTVLLTRVVYSDQRENPEFQKNSFSPVASFEIDSFLEASIPVCDALCVSDFPKYGYAKGAEKYKKNIQNSIPLLSEYIFREKGVPPSHVINKWDNDQEIVVTMNWPSGVNHYDLPYADLNDEKTVTLRDTISKNVAEVRKDTGLNIVMDDKGGSIPTFVISFLDSNAFKTDSNKISRVFDSFTQSPLFHKSIEPLFIGAFPFLPSDKSSVDGYILTSSTNSIEWAVCYLNPNLSLEIVSVHIKECFFRGLGLVNLSDFALKKDSDQLQDETEKLVEFLKFLYSDKIQAGDNYWDVIKKTEGDN